MMPSALKIILLLSLSAFCHSTLAAEKRVGEYVIHYNAFASDFLSPEIAKLYGITRSRNIALLNVTVLREDQHGNQAPADILVEASAVNLVNQLKSIQLRKIQDAGAIYHMGEFGVSDREALSFSILLRDQNKEITTIEFRQQFFK